MIRNDLPWEKDLVEGPWTFFYNGWYYLFYSGSGYCGAEYAVGVARSINPLGPYEKKGDPIRKSDSRFIGPGHCSVIKTKDNKFAMIYHSWVDGEVCTPEGRKLMVDYVSFNEQNWPQVENESITFLSR